MENAVQDNARTATPTHLWIVGVVSLIWNCFGAYDYLMTRLRNTDYLSQMGNPQAMLDYIDSFPLWAQAGWGFGVWGALLGSILLLMRSRHAVLAFLISLIGAVLSLGYQMLGPPGPAEFTEGMMAIVPFFIIAIALALFLYARAMRRKGVLR